MNFTLVIVAGILSLLCHAGALKFFPRLGLLDYPERYGLKRSRLPYPTGVIPLLLFVILLPSIGGFTWANSHLIGAILLLGIISFVDDRHQVSAPWRLATQALCAFFVFAAGARVYTLTNPLGGIIKLDTIDLMTTAWGPLPVWGGIFTIFWLMLTTNALNWFDGIPGQVSLLSVIGFITIGLLSLSSRVNQPELALIAFVLAALALGSLVFNLPPNKVVAGDTGAMFFGFLLGVLTVYSGGKVATAFLVLGVPLIDLFLVIAQRLWQRQSPFAGNLRDQHLHHRLINNGWNEWQVIGLTAALGTSFGITALFLSTQGKVIAALILLLIMIGLSYYSKPPHGS